MRTQKAGASEGDNVTTNWGQIFVVLFMSAFFVIAVIVFGIMIIAFYFDLKMDKNNQLENWRGDHSWQDVYVNQERIQFAKSCQENGKTAKKLMKLLENKGVQVPPEMAVVEECVPSNPNAHRPNDEGEH